MKKIILLLALLFIVSGCSYKVVPDKTDSGSINDAGKSLTMVKEGIAVEIAYSNADFNAYNLDGYISAFNVQIDNQSDKEVSFDADSFLLVDNEGKQYNSLPPAKVKELISKDSYYLIPYPYVGFYYLEDYEKSSFYNTYNSQLPYYYEVYPQDIFTKALSAEALIPKAKATGLVYFKIDLSNKKSVKLLLFKKGSSKAITPDYIFPFKIEK